MNEEIENKMNDWLTNERATEHSLDNRRFYEFVFASLNYNEKIEQALYDEKISSYRTTNRFFDRCVDRKIQL